MIRLDRSYFERPTLEVAKSILGSKLHFYGQAGIITEAEAYIGQKDPACHAAKGLTQRTKAMFGPAGHSYVYLIYGMYYCLNIVTEEDGFPAAILLRGVLCSSTKEHFNGPGKLCRAFGITTEHNQQDICENENFFLTKGPQITDIETTPRIGISSGQDLPWRFVATKEAIKQLKVTL